MALEKVISKLAFGQLLDAQSSHDIIPGRVDAREQRMVEEEDLARRMAEESGPCITRRPTPVECVKLGLTLDKAQVMRPEDLTREDAEYLVSRGVKMTHIGELYGFEIKKLYNLLGNKWGLRRNRDVPEYPWSAEKLDAGPEPASDAARQLIESSEIKIATREVPTPAPEIDISAMRRFVPGNTSKARPNYTMTMSPKGTLRLAAGLAAAGPAEHAGPGSRFIAEIRVSDDGRLLVVKISHEGYTFSSFRGSAGKKSSAKPVAKYLVSQGIVLPAVYQAEWNAELQAYVGRLIEKPESEAV